MPADKEPEIFVLEGAELQQFINGGYRNAFGVTREEAMAERVCASCKQPPTFSTDAGRREYAISGICEPCFDAMFAEPDDD